MSLVYTTLLSIVPLTAFSFSLLKGLGIHKQFEARLYTVLEPLGEKSVEITDQLIALVNNVDGRVLGGIGLAFFLYTAISMVQKIEESFNYVWYVTKPRSFSRQFTEYVFVLLIGPLAIVIALGLITSLNNESAVQYLIASNIVGPLVQMAGKLIPYLVVIGVFSFLYMFMPNTSVNLKSALVGGLLGGFLWASVGVIFTAFIANSAGTQAVYASFAIAIVALIWLILLIGSQLAFYHQNPEYMRNGRREPRLSNAMRERLALNIMFLVGRAFRNNGEEMSLAKLSDTLKIPSITLTPIVIDLEENGLLTRTEKECLQPGQDISRLPLEDILRVAREEGDTGSSHNPHWASEVEGLGKELDRAICNTVASMMLADLLDQAEQKKA